MKLYKYLMYLLMLPLALMTASCSDETKESIVEEESSANQLKSVYSTNEKRLWTPGETIKYYIDPDYCGTAAHQRILRECMDEIENYANIRFEAIARRGRSNVVIAFYETSYSQLKNYSGSFKRCKVFHVGDDAYVNYTYKQPVLELLVNSWGDSEAEVRSIILHNLFHLLGFMDEVNNPNANLRLSQSKMVNWYNKSNPSNPRGETVYYTEFGSYKKKEYTSLGGYTAFDPNSIMMVDILSSWTTNGKSYKHNNKLSDIDIQKLQELYPYGGLVRLYVGSKTIKNGNGTFYSDGVIGPKEYFAKGGTIRKFIGYGYKYNINDKTKTNKITPGYEGYESSEDMAYLETYVKTYGYTVYNPDNVFENVIYSDELRQGLVLGYLKTNNEISVTNKTKPWFILGNSNEKNPYVYKYIGDGRTPICTYYNKKNGHRAISYSDDTYLTDKGYVMNDWIGAVRNDSYLPRK